MKELKSWNLENVADKYGAMKNASVSMQKVEDGKVLPLDAWIMFEDMDAKSGEVQTVLAIKSEGVLYNTISQTFIREFSEAWEFFEEAGAVIEKIAVVHGLTKAGRSYVSCEVR